MDVVEGRARVTRADASADIALDASDLGALFLGGVGATALSLAGRVMELSEGGLALADRLFQTSVQPWCPQEF
jgi:predicted acetyltransferase